jgi:hypothetical protein
MGGDAMTDATQTRKAATYRTRTALGFALLALCLGGAASASTSHTSENSGDAPALEDGLQPVEIRGPGKFWVRPGADLAGYDRAALMPLEIEYKSNPRHYRIDRPVTGVLWTERDRERIQQSFYDAFKVGLANGEGFGPASKPNPGLLWVTASLVDVVVHYNREPAADELSWVHDYGEMTLRIVFSDSQTGEALARFEERRIIRPSTSFNQEIFRRDLYPYWSAMRANLSRWSELVRRRMHDQRARAIQF